MATFTSNLAIHCFSPNNDNRKEIAPTNPRGIPYAPFVDKVEDYVTSRADVEATLKNFQEMISYVLFVGTRGNALNLVAGNINSWKQTNNGELQA
jgi:hypothetical protein